MKRLLVAQVPSVGRSVELPESEAVHAVRVLRLRDGQSVEIIDGHGHASIAALKVRGDRVWVEATEPNRESGANEVLPIELELAVLKGEAMEWAVEKAVELGVRRLVPVLTAHTVVQTKGKGPEAFRERWQKIADQALKQCGRLTGLVVETPVELEALLQNRPVQSPDGRIWLDEATRALPTLFIADWLNQAKPADDLRLLIGPEGGWSEREREILGLSTTRLNLGPLVLRAETAALFAVSLAAGRYRRSS